MKHIPLLVQYDFLNHAPKNAHYRELFYEEVESGILRIVNGKNLAIQIKKSSGINVTQHSDTDSQSQIYANLANFEQHIAAQKSKFGKNYHTHYEASEGQVIPCITQYLLEQYGQYSPAIKNRLAQEISLVSSSATFSVTHRQYTVTTSETPPQFDEQIYVSFIVSLTGKSPNGGIEEVYEKITFTHKNDVLQLDEILSCIQKALDDLLFLYGAKQCPSGEFPCVFGTEAGGVIIHEAIGHGLEADLLQSSVYRGKIGQKIAHADVCIFEDPTMIGYRGSYVMDHEGVLAQKKYLVKNGVLVNYMHSRKTARHFEVEPNGHARRESYAHPTLVRMGITFLTSEHPKAPNKTDLIAAISDGVYISKMGGGQVDPSTGDFVFKVQRGYLIKNGVLTDGIRGAMVAGNGPKLLQSIQGVSNDIVYYDGGTCGKGQHMPVSDATASFSSTVTITGQ